MHKPVSATPPSEPENKCPDCLCIELELFPIQPHGFLDKIPRFRAKEPETEQLNLHLTIQFNEQRQPLPGGEVRFGIKRGELRLILENANIPLASRELGSSFELSIPIERQEQEGIENQSGLEASLTDTKPGIKASLGAKKIADRKDKFQFTRSQVTPKGSPQNPAWVFEVETGQPVLKGLLRNAKLATVNVSGKPCIIKATFQVSSIMQDVYVTHAEGVYPPDVNKRWSAVFERWIIRHHLEPLLKPHLSRVELRYD